MQSSVLRLHSGGRPRPVAAAPLRPRTTLRQRPTVTPLAATATRRVGGGGATTTTTSTRSPSPPIVMVPLPDPTSSSTTTATTTYRQPGRRQDGPVVLAEVRTPSPSPSAATTTTPAPPPTTPTSSSRAALRTGVEFDWSRDDYNETARTLATWQFFLTFRARLFLLDAKWSYAPEGGFSDARRSRRAASLGRYLLESCLALGPCFIKVGQLASSRTDLFPLEFTSALSELTDRVPAFSFERARAVIEKELGQPLEAVYADFDPVPVAAASLGQVHAARLRSTGQKVAVKVQRPGLKRLFEIDLKNLKILAQQLERQRIASDGDDVGGGGGASGGGSSTTTSFLEIYEECATTLRGEADYLKEGRSADAFRRAFSTSRIPWVRVPKIEWSATSGRVLTMEYVGAAARIDDPAALRALGVDPVLTAKRAAESYVLQLLRHGLIHADPHPGNVAIDAQGRLIYWDFGMMSTVPSDVRERMLDLFSAISRSDADGTVAALVELGVLRPTGDAMSVKRAVAYFIKNLRADLSGEAAVGTIGADLFAIAVDQPFAFPAAFVFLLRALTTLEGTGKVLDPDYSFVSIAAPYAAELLAEVEAERGLLPAASGGLAGALGALAAGGGGNGNATALVLGQLRRAATEQAALAAAVPSRLARIDGVVASLEAGDLQLRVRDLAGERAARRAGVVASSSLNAAGALGFLNLGALLALASTDGLPQHAALSGPAGLSLAVSALFGALVLRGFRRVKRLDSFERRIRGG
jgi:predicted unusual protein kinase regulating ubiquinone biosynthesis (AarF/ABC1/UbiB family)